MSYDPLMDEGPSAPETTWALNKDGELKRWVVAEVPVFKDMRHVPVWKRTMQVLVKTVGWLVQIPAVIGVLIAGILSTIGMIGWMTGHYGFFTFVFWSVALVLLTACTVLGVMMTGVMRDRT